MAPERAPQQSQPDPSRIPKPSPLAYRPKNPFLNLFPEDFQRDIWLSKTKDHFHQLILWAERQPSNGTVRTVDRPDGETRFTVAYGNYPDGELQELFVCFLLLKYGWDMWTDHGL